MTHLIKVLKSSLVAATLVIGSTVVADDQQAQPLLLAQATDGFDVQAAYMRTCFACHNAGAGGAPMPNDAEAWSARMEKGMEAVMQNVINGLNAMPAKGLCFDCTNEDLAAIVEYMYETSQN